jgi:hypothetical protein
VLPAWAVVMWLTVGQDRDPTLRSAGRWVTLGAMAVWAVGMLTLFAVWAYVQAAAWRRSNRS